MSWQVPFVRSVLEHDRVVLCAPTGAGKTAAALAAFVAGRSVHFADRCIYALPMRALARSLFDSYAPALREHGLRATLQMGGASLDPDYRGDVVFTTIDQLLSRYLMAPYGGRPGNISAGALVGAHIVLDEFHLYPQDQAKLTSIAMLDHLRGASSQVVMTATLPDAARRELADILGAHTYRVTAVDMARSGDRELPRRAWQWRHEALDPKAALSAWRRAGEPRRVLVCANTVSRAQRLFTELRRAPAPGEITLVHARFLARDRDAHEMTARQWLGAGEIDGPRWVVATQVIEAGIDASADLVLTELAPASSLVQRAGRCARWRRAAENKPPEGAVVVFRDPALQAFLPYEADVVERTWRVREDVCPGEGALFEERLVEHAHGQEDLDGMRRIRSRLGSRRDEVFRAIEAGDCSARWRLIRNVSSQSVLVRSDGGTIDWERVPDTVSVADAALRRLLRDAAALRGALVPTLTDDGIRWAPPSSVEEALAAPLLVLSPDHAAYDVDVGLSFGTPGGETPIVFHRTREQADRLLTYEKDTFEEHIGRCVMQARAFLDAAVAARSRLAALAGTSSETLAGAALLATALHDTGKLTSCWQSWAAEWQRVVHGDVLTRCVAHTAWNPADPAARRRSLEVRSRRPPHAVEGAVLARPVVERWVDAAIAGEPVARAIERAVVTSIARHHSVRALRAQLVTLDPRAKGCVERALRCAGCDAAAAGTLREAIRRVDTELSSDDIASPLHERGALEVLLYWFVARIVRLADRHSFDPIEPAAVTEEA